MSNIVLDGITDTNSEDIEIGYTRGRRTCVSQNDIQNNESNFKDEDKRFSQAQLENILSQREDIISEQYEIIISELKQKLQDLEDQLSKDNEDFSAKEEQAIQYVKEAHVCPFNCFKGQDIKITDVLSQPQLREISSTQTSKDLSDVQIRDKNLSTPGSINFVSDKQFKANLFLQKKLENAGKEIEKNKLQYLTKLDTLQQKHDDLLSQLNSKQEKDESNGGQLEDLSIKLLEIEDQKKALQDKLTRIEDFIKDQFSIELQQQGESEQNVEIFNNFMSEWENKIGKNKNEFVELENQLEQVKKEFASKHKTLSQRESEHGALIQKIASAEIQLDEVKQENIHFSEQLSYETQRRKEVEQNQRNDLLEIYQLLEGGENYEGTSVSIMKDNIMYQIRIMQRDVQKMSTHKKSLEKLDEENFQMKLDLQRTNSLNNNLEKLRNDFDTLNYKYLQAQEKIMLLEKENQRMTREKQTSDEIQVENLKNLNQKLATELASLHQTRSRESSDLQEKIEKLHNKLTNIKRENEDLRLLIRSRNNTQDDCEQINREEELEEEQKTRMERLDTIEERRGESLDSDNKSQFFQSLEDKKLEMMAADQDQNQMILNKNQSQSMTEMLVLVEEEHKSIFEIQNMNQLKKAFLSLYKRLKDDKIYAEQTAIDTKIQLAEMAMSKDYFEHNFIKLLKKVK